MSELKVHGSLESPIKVEEARFQKDEYIRWQWAYIDRRTTLCKKTKQTLHKPKEGVYVDEVHIREANGTEGIFWFDISDAMNAEQKFLEEREKKKAAMGLK